MSNPRLAIIGSGIAGLSVGAATAADFQVTVVEAEVSGGYHSSGRSATIFQKNFETDLFSRMAEVSEDFFLAPPQGYEGVASPLPRLLVAKAEEKPMLDNFLDAWQPRNPWLIEVTQAESRRLFPPLADIYQHAILDEECLTLDIAILLDGHRRMIRAHEGVILNNHRLCGVTRTNGEWTLEFETGEKLTTDIIVNAAGAWADKIAEQCGINPIGLQPKRRTAIHIDPKEDCSRWATVYRVSSDLYIKPEGNMLMVSPQDEHDSAPTDAQPELLDIAITVERFEETTTTKVERPARTWAGLRSFVPDRNPVIGYADDEQNFFWVAAFGGAGILSSPCYSHIGAKLLAHEELPSEWAIEPSELGVERLQNA